MKKVSVIIPVYDASKYLNYCIDSLQNQTYTNLELIFVNDGSKDNSLEILKKAQENDKRIKIINQKNLGVASARNNGLQAATGSFVMFMDNDDKIDSDYIELLVNKIENDMMDIVITGYTRESYSGKILFKRLYPNDKLAKYFLVAPWGKIYRTKFIKKYKFMNSKIADEFNFLLLAYDNTDKVEIIQNTGYHWMYNEKSLSNTANKKLQLVDDLLHNLSEIKNNITNFNSEVEYFYIRTIIYYLLFSCKKVNKKIIYNKYDEMFSWLKETVPNYNKNKYLCLFSSSSETLSIRLLIKVFLLLDRLKVGKVFLNLYSKI